MVVPQRKGYSMPKAKCKITPDHIKSMGIAVCADNVAVVVHKFMEEHTEHGKDSKVVFDVTIEVSPVT